MLEWTIRTWKDTGEFDLVGHHGELWLVYLEVHPRRERIKKITFSQTVRLRCNNEDRSCTRRIANGIRNACKGKALTPDLVKNAVETMMTLEGY